jgi:putative salt-induced outer membrane protein YdiY
VNTATRSILAAALVAAAPALALAEDEVTLKSGDVLKGRVVEKSDLEVVLEHPNLGKITLPAGQVKSVTTEADRIAKAKKEAEPKWTSRIEAGLSGAEGNTDNLNFIAGLASDYRLPRGLWHFESRYFYKETEGEPTENRFYALLRRDWQFEKEERYTFFAEARYDRDQFQQWNQRAIAAGGVTYKFVEKEDLFVAFRVGGAATKEWGLEGPDQDDDVRPEGLIGVETKWKVDETKEATAQATYYPDLSDLWEYRVLATGGLKYRLDQKGSLNLAVGAEYEYDTHRKDPFKRADVRYFALLTFDF